MLLSTIHLRSTPARPTVGEQSIISLVGDLYLTFFSFFHISTFDIFPAFGVFAFIQKLIDVWKTIFNENYWVNSDKVIMWDVQPVYLKYTMAGGGIQGPSALLTWGHMLLESGEQIFLEVKGWLKCFYTLNPWKYLTIVTHKNLWIIQYLDSRHSSSHSTHQNSQKNWINWSK